tara:strand:- start:1090 stop:2259 length:1170 start_codon:yes stop_codon:yes gene_type:complete
MKNVIKGSPSLLTTVLLVPALSAAIVTQNAQAEESTGTMQDMPMHQGMDHSMHTEQMPHDMHGQMPADMPHNMDGMHQGMDHEMHQSMHQGMHGEQMPHDMHSQMPEDMQHDMNGMHQGMNHEMHQNMDHSMHQGMHGEQPASAPVVSNDRDPHAYSDGLTLSKGPYALPGPRQMKMADEHRFWSVIGDRLEYEPDDDRGAYDLTAWYGTTWNRLQVNAEGEFADGSLEEAETEVLWNHALTGYFDTLLGARFDTYNGDEGDDRQWLALGIQGLAPYWFETSLTFYLGDEGRTALSGEAEYDLLFTQRLVLQTRAELTAYGKDDEENGVYAGFTDGVLGLRLRYEISRQFAPYIGVEWTRAFGKTADMADDAGAPVTDTHYLAGIKFWF